MDVLLAAFDDLVLVGDWLTEFRDGRGAIASFGDLAEEPSDAPLRRDGDWLVAEVAGSELWMYTQAQDASAEFTDGLRVGMRTAGGQEVFTGVFSTPERRALARELSTEAASARSWSAAGRGWAVHVPEPTVACVLAAVRDLIADGLGERDLTK